MPPELRSLLSNPVTAKSIRDLCQAVQVAPTRNTYLCAELGKADAGFVVPATPLAVSGPEQARLEAEEFQRQNAARQGRESLDR